MSKEDRELAVTLGGLAVACVLAARGFVLSALFLALMAMGEC